jgi:hypothetical protein
MNRKKMAYQKQELGNVSNNKSSFIMNMTGAFEIDYFY